MRGMLAHAVLVLVATLCALGGAEQGEPVLNSRMEYEEIQEDEEVLTNVLPGQRQQPKITHNGESIGVGQHSTAEPAGDARDKPQLWSYPLTSADFDWYVGNGSRWLVFFYAPWCAHCRMVGPAVENAARACTQQQQTGAGPCGEPAANIARVDATAELALAARFLVSSYPTLFVVEPSGASQEYKGRRNEASILAFLRNEALPDDSRGEKALVIGQTAWLHPLSPMAPWVRWVFMLHPLNLLFAAFQHNSVFPFHVGIVGNIILVVSIIPIYIVFVTCALILILESIGSIGQWRYRRQLDRRGPAGSDTKKHN